MPAWRLVCGGAAASRRWRIFCVCYGAPQLLADSRGSARSPQVLSRYKRVCAACEGHGDRAAARAALWRLESEFTLRRAVNALSHRNLYSFSRHADDKPCRRLPNASGGAAGRLTARTRRRLKANSLFWGPTSPHRAAEFAARSHLTHPCRSPQAPQNPNRQRREKKPDPR